MYTTQAVCNPSRTSLLTSRRPDTSRIWDNGDTGGTAMWRIEGGNFTSLPQHFKDEGYIVLGTGKIYHPISMGFPGAFDYDRNYSWSPECLPCPRSSSLPLSPKPLLTQAAAQTATSSSSPAAPPPSAPCPAAASPARL